MLPTYDVPRLRALLSKGYFPHELPSVFTSVDFADNAGSILAEWEANGIFTRKQTFVKKKKAKDGGYEYKLRATEAEMLSKPKRGYERRTLHLTHPVPQALLCYEMAANWRILQRWLSRNRFSLDRIDVSDAFGGSIKDVDFALHRAKKDFITSSHDWLVETDITRFYPSIYTHSIPWAAYGKERVKADLKRYGGSLADRLDVLVRNCNRNQTVGIPIGPATSHVIAAIISSRIDEMIEKNLKGVNYLADRLQDDWSIGCYELSDAEYILSTLIGAYRAFGLDINGVKTEVLRLIEHQAPSWEAELTSFYRSARSGLRGSSLRTFLNLAISLQATHPAGRVVGYAMSMLEEINLSEKDVATVESFLLKAAAVSSISLSRICQTLITIESTGKRISKSRVRERFVHLLEKNLVNGNDYEVIWLIYTLRGLKISFKSKLLTQAMDDTRGSVIPLMLLDMKSKSLYHSSIPIGEWETRYTKESIESEPGWMLLYEGIRHRWLKDTNNLMQSRMFKPLIDRGIQFYDPKKNVLSTRATRRMRLSRLKKIHGARTRLIDMLRGVEFPTHFSEY